MTAPQHPLPVASSVLTLFVASFALSVYLSGLEDWRAPVLFTAILAGPVLAGLSIRKQPSAPVWCAVIPLLFVSYTAVYYSKASGYDSPRWNVMHLYAASFDLVIQLLAYGCARAIRSRVAAPIPR